MIQFPSPCGVLVLKSKKYLEENPLDKEFPSPCGVLVLKYDIAQLHHIHWIISVPLRGSGS